MFDWIFLYRNFAIDFGSMAVAKTEIFSEQENRLANYAKALAHPARVAILKFLIRKNACVCGDIVKEIGLAQSTVSQHLKELKKIGVIKGTVEGVSVCYCIDQAIWQQMTRELKELLEIDFRNFNECC